MCRESGSKEHREQISEDAGAARLVSFVHLFYGAVATKGFVI